MDGVLADTYLRVCEVHGFDPEDYPPGEYALSKAFGQKYDETWNHPEILGEEFWATLPKFPWADALVAWATAQSRGGVCFLTQPMPTPGCHAGKARWLRDHYPGVPYMIGTHKTRLSRPGLMLIDDSDENVRGWRAAGGSAILFPALVNSAHAFRDDPMPVVLRAFAEISRG